MPSTFQTTQQMNLLSKLVEELREDHPRLEVVIPIEDGHNPRSFEPFAYLSANYVRGPEKYTALFPESATLQGDGLLSGNATQLKCTELPGPC